MIAIVLGLKARFCGPGCRDSFRSDRQCGLIYGPYLINGVFALHVEEASLATCACAYCGDHVNGKIPQSLKDKFNFTPEIVKKLELRRES